MASNEFLVNLAVGFRNNASSGIKSLNQDLENQKRKVTELKNTERLRSLEAQKSLATGKVNVAQTQLLHKAEQARQKQLLANTTNRPQDFLSASKAKLGQFSAEQKLESAKNRVLGLEKKIGLETTKNLSSSASASGGFLANMTKSITAANLLSGAISGGITVAIDLASAALGKLVEQFQSAISTSQNVISGTTAISRNFNLSRNRAREVTIEQQKSIEVLGRDLPVSSKDISEAFSLALNAGLAKLAPGDIKQFNQLALGNTGDLGVIPLATVLKEQLGSTITNVQYQQAIAALPQATSVSELNRLEFFRSSGLADELKKSGFDNAGSPIERFKLYQAALKKLLPPEAIAELQGTIPALTSGLIDRLFADRTGIFGFLRDLDPKLKGDQTVFGSASRTIDLLIGKDGLFDQMGNLFGDYDPLVKLKEAIDGLNAFIETFNKTIAGINDSPLKEPVSKSVGFLQQAQYYVTTPGAPLLWLASQLNGGSSQTAKYSGSALSAANGFYGNALSEEIRNKPAGSSIVIANSSETVLTPKQLDNVRSSNQAIGRNKEQNRQQSSVLNIERGAIAIYQAPGESVEVLTEKVIDRLNEMVDRRSRTTYSFS